MKCRFFRFWIGYKLDDGRPLSPRLERHFRHCPECAAWLQTQRSLIRQLRRPVPSATDPPPFLQAKILRAIGDSRPAQPETPPWIWLTGAAAVTMAVITLFAVQPDQQKMAGTAATAPPPAIMSAAAARLSDSGILLRAAARLDQPLQHEMTLLKEDALAALRALKTGFVPDALLSREG